MENNKPKWKPWQKWTMGITIVILVLVIIASNSTPAKSGDTATSSPAAASKSVGIGQVLQTQYFDVTCHGWQKVSSIPAADLKKEEGNMYMIIDLSFKNTDKESRMMSDGDLLLNVDGKEYKFEQPEMVMLEGYGILLDNINPLMTKRTKLVYKVPSTLTGTASYRPGRSDDDQQILLGPTATK